ncbi:MAG: hypothetical protein ACRD12_03345 [Acidimicrobiales bacterium]
MRPEDAHDGASGAPLGAGLLALIPAASGAGAAYLLRTAGAEDFAQVGSAAVILLVGAPLARLAVRRDEGRAVTAAGAGDDRVEPGAPSALVVKPGPATIGLAVVLGAAAFVLVDLLASIFAYGSLTFFGTAAPEDFYLAGLVRGLPIVLLAAVPISVAVGHRLRDRWQAALHITVLLYVVGVIGLNAFLNATLNGELTAQHIFFPMIAGGVAYLGCQLGDLWAKRTQARFDLVRAVKLDLARRSRREFGPDAGRAHARSV